MTANQFYEQLVRDLAVDMTTIEAARDRRDELRATVETVTRRWIAGADSFPAGALAMGLQIAPLNDVDVVLRVPTRLASWVHTPHQALIDVRDWLDEEIDAHFELTSHAIRLNYPDEDFTADLVVGYENPAGAGLLIPHCPEDKPWEHDWIRTHPALHRDLIKKRTEDLGHESRFAKEIRVLKHLNRQWKVEHDRKILSSHHTTSLAWHIFQSPFEFATGTTEFLDRAAGSRSTRCRTPPASATRSSLGTRSSHRGCSRRPPKLLAAPTSRTTRPACCAPSSVTRRSSPRSPSARRSASIPQARSCPAPTA